MARRSLTAGDAANAAAAQPEGGAAQVQPARARQLRAAKQVRTALTVAVPTAGAARIPKIQVARAVQPRQIAALKSLRPALPESVIVTRIPKVAKGRVAQSRQRATTKSTRRQAT
jgi:hypothetical protein